MTLVTILFLFSSFSSAEITCQTTPTQCYEEEQKRKAEAIRLKQEREEAAYRQQKLELQNAQLRELQEQRAVIQEELQQMNASQQRVEEMQRKQMEEEAQAKKKKLPE